MKGLYNSWIITPMPGLKDKYGILWISLIDSDIGTN